jgi:hypothetical protein
VVKAILAFSKPKQNEKRQPNNELLAMTDVTEAMKEFDKQWNLQYEKLVDFKE